MIDPCDQTAALKTVSVCDTQPVTAEGVRTLLRDAGDLRFLTSYTSPEQAMDLMPCAPPDVLLLDKAFNGRTVLDWLTEWRSHRAEGNHTAVVVWGALTTQAEAWCLLHAGVRGILPRTSDSAALLSCLRSVAGGQYWFNDVAGLDARNSGSHARMDLTSREQQVFDRVERGLTNIEIAKELGICVGTVKIHLRHIYGKTGVNGRHALLLSNLSNGRRVAA